MNVNQNFQNQQMGWQQNQPQQMGWQPNQQMGWQQQQNPQMGWQQQQNQINPQMGWQQQQNQQFQQCQQQQQQQQQKLSYYQQLIQTNPQQLFQMLQMSNNFMEAYNNFPILFSNIYQGNQYLFQSIRNIYPQQIQQIMSMYPQYFQQSQPQPQPQPTNNNSGLKELLPRNNQTMNYNEVTDNNQCVINISFIASTGNRILLAVNGNITIEELLKRYVKRLNLPETAIKKDIMFSYNGEQIDEMSKELVMNQFKNGDNINVYDINNIIGA